jgi:hypothetical protein
MLAEEHKRKGTAALLQNRCSYQDGELLVKSTNTEDETWVYKFTPESKKKLHDLEVSSFTQYKKKFKIELSAIKKNPNGDHVLGL